MDLLATYYSSSSSSSAAAAGGIFAGLMAFFGAIWLFAMAMVVISIIANWKFSPKLVVKVGNLSSLSITTGFSLRLPV